MSDAVKVGFVPFSSAARGVLVVFCDDALKFGAATRKALGTAADTRQARGGGQPVQGQERRRRSIFWRRRDLRPQRLIVIGAGKPSASRRRIFSNSAA